MNCKHANQLIGCCGLDCEVCDARIATLTNDTALREKTAALWIISGVIGTPLSFVHSAAVFSRRAVSFVSVAIRASQTSQSSPQQPISWFACLQFISIFHPTFHSRPIRVFS